jgi:hypothetical protein
MLKHSEQKMTEDLRRVRDAIAGRGSTLSEDDVRHVTRSVIMEGEGGNSKQRIRPLRR